MRRVNESCAPPWPAENWGFALKETLFFFLGRKEGLKGALSPEHLSKTEVAVKEFTAQADEINRQWAFTKKYKG